MADVRGGGVPAKLGKHEGVLRVEVAFLEEWVNTRVGLGVSRRMGKHEGRLRVEVRRTPCFVNIPRMVVGCWRVPCYENLQKTSDRRIWVQHANGRRPRRRRSSKAGQTRGCAEGPGGVSRRKGKHEGRLRVEVAFLGEWVPPRGVGVCCQRWLLRTPLPRAAAPRPHALGPATQPQRPPGRAWVNTRVGRWASYTSLREV